MLDIVVIFVLNAHYRPVGSTGQDRGLCGFWKLLVISIIKGLALFNALAGFLNTSLLKSRFYRISDCIKDACLFEFSYFTISKQPGVFLEKPNGSFSTNTRIMQCSYFCWAGSGIFIR